MRGLSSKATHTVIARSNHLATVLEMRVGLFCAATIWFFPAIVVATAPIAAAELVDYVNTLQGTNSRFEFSHGNTFPAVAMPNGMHMWTPQTGRNGDGWKYQYEKDSIRGFQQSHQCSSWSNDYAVFSLMPVVGELVVDENARDRGAGAHGARRVSARRLPAGPNRLVGTRRIHGRSGGRGPGRPGTDRRLGAQWAQSAAELSRTFCR
jgi:hypothetical protein